MQSHFHKLAAVLFMQFGINTLATVLYVDLNNPS